MPYELKVIAFGPCTTIDAGPYTEIVRVDVSLLPVTPPDAVTVPALKVMLSPVSATVTSPAVPTEPAESVIAWPVSAIDIPGTIDPAESDELAPESANVFVAKTLPICSVAVCPVIAIDLDDATDPAEAVSAMPVNATVTSEPVDTVPALSVMLAPVSSAVRD